MPMICRISIPHFEISDQMLWNMEQSGVDLILVENMYAAIDRQGERLSTGYRLGVEIEESNRIRAWLWKVRCNGICTKAFLFKRVMAMVATGVGENTKPYWLELGEFADC